MFRQFCQGVLFIALAGCVAEAQEVPSPPASPNKGETKCGVEGAPPEFHTGTHGGIIFADPPVVHQVCTSNMPPLDKNIIVLACTNPANRVMLLPNPCLYAEVDPYARLMCHEMAHLNGWKHEA